MIKIPKLGENLSISVILKDGRKFKEKDITEKPFGNNDLVVSFWENDDTVAIFPMDAVKEYRLHFK